MGTEVRLLSIISSLQYSCKIAALVVETHKKMAKGYAKYMRLNETLM